MRRLSQCLSHDIQNAVYINSNKQFKSFEKSPNIILYIILRQINVKIFNSFVLALEMAIFALLLQKMICGLYNSY